jgi:hypothetical protein
VFSVNRLTIPHRGIACNRRFNLDDFLDFGAFLFAIISIAAWAVFA